MTKFILRLAINAIALYLAVLIVPGIDLRGSLQDADRHTGNERYQQQRCCQALLEFEVQSACIAWCSRAQTLV